jgi:hypothetical protein
LWNENFPHGSASNASTVLVASANIMALGLLIHRSFFSVGNNIGLALPTNLLLMDGLRQGEGILLLVYELSPLILSSSGDNFLGWSYSSFVFPFQFLVDCYYMMHCHSFASFA